jgi:2'-5' RNA ligase
MTILDGPLRDEASRLWRVFEVEYGSVGVQTFPHPNLTFGAGRSRDAHALAGRMENLSKGFGSFELRVTGICCFSEPHKVVFLRVALTEQLAAIHRSVDRVLQQHCEDLFEHYRPAAWVPHITIGMGDLSQEAFERARTELSAYNRDLMQSACELSVVQSALEGPGFEVVRRWKVGNQGGRCDDSK